MYVKLKQEFYFLQSVAANLCCSHVMPSFLDHFFATPRSHNAHPCMFHLCNKGILISGILSNGVMIKDWRWRDETKSLLWVIDTWLCYSTHTRIEVANHDPSYNYVGVLSPRGPFPHLAFIVLSGDLYIRSKSGEFFFWSYQEDNLRKNCYWTKMIEDYKKW